MPLFVPQSAANVGHNDTIYRELATKADARKLIWNALLTPALMNE